jgi:hypothetical protein
MLAALSATPGLAAPPADIVAQPVQLRLPSYSASGTHQCGANAASCVVTGLAYRDCNDATSSLRAQDCCASRRSGQASTGFTLNYCIPEMGVDPR